MQPVTSTNIPDFTTQELKDRYALLFDLYLDALNEMKRANRMYRDRLDTDTANAKKKRRALKEKIKRWINGYRDEMRLIDNYFWYLMHSTPVKGCHLAEVY